MLNTSRLARQIGEDLLARIVNASRGHRVRVPILGTRYAVADGDVVHPGAEAGGFSSLSDLISEATAGKQQKSVFFKDSNNNVTGTNSSLWNRGESPAAGGTPAARPGGAVPTRTTTGALGQANAASGDTLHITTAFCQSDYAPTALLVYDRLFHAATIDHTVATAQTITGVPTRYTGTAAVGNFAFLEVTTALGGTAANVTMTYVDQDGNTAEAAPAKAILTASSYATQICHDPYFIPLNAPDTGLRNATQVQFSAANSAGVSNFVIGHPICWITMGRAYDYSVMDGINSAFNLTQIVDGACLAFLDLNGQANAPQYTGELIMVSG